MEKLEVSVYRRLSQHANDYFSFYLWTFLGICSAIECLLLVVSEGKSTGFMYMTGNIAIMVGGYIPQKGGAYRFGLIVIGVVMAILSLPFNVLAGTSLSPKILEFMVVIQSVWLGAISLLNTEHIKPEKNELSRVLKRWAVLSVGLLACTLLIVKYNNKNIEIIFHKGSYFIEGGLTSKEINALIDVQHMYTIGFILAGIILFVSCFYNVYVNSELSAKSKK